MHPFAGLVRHQEKLGSTGSASSLLLCCLMHFFPRPVAIRIAIALVIFP